MGLPLLSAIVATAHALAPNTWDRAPVFIHTNYHDVPLTERELVELKRFDLITLEKNQGGTGPDVVARIVAAAKQLKAVTDAPVLMYTNLLLDWPQFATLHEEFAANAADWRLEDARGAVVSVKKSGLDMACFDQANASMRAAWKRQCADAVATGALDGCFVDRAAQYQYGCNARKRTNGGKPLISNASCDAYAAAQTELQAEVDLVISNCGGQADVAACPPTGVAGVMFEFWCDVADGTAKNWPGMGPPESTCADLVKQAAALGDDHVVLIHRGVGAANNATYSYAAFLLAAGNYSKFGDGAWAGDWTWLDAYDRPLGAPKGSYYVAGDDELVLRRDFERVGVVVDTRNSIAWLNYVT